MMENTDFGKSYYKMKDTSDIIGVPQSTLRFWEKEFDEVNPRRSIHNQRYYSPSDIETLRIVKFLIKDKGLKIEAAKEYLKKNRENITKKIEVIQNLEKVKEDLAALLRTLNIRGQIMGLPPEEV